MASEQTDFDAVLYPHRTLGRTGMRILVVVIAFSMIYVGLLFYSMGAWPILGFCGLELLLVLYILHLNKVSGYHKEHVRLSSTHLIIEDHPYKKPVKKWELPRGRVRVFEDRVKNCVVVSDETHQVMLGRFLTPEEREHFIASLQKALRCYA